MNNDTRILFDGRPGIEEIAVQHDAAQKKINESKIVNITELSGALTDLMLDAYARAAKSKNIYDIKPTTRILDEKNSTLVSICERLYNKKTAEYLQNIMEKNGAAFHDLLDLAEYEYKAFTGLDATRHGNITKLNQDSYINRIISNHTTRLYSAVQNLYRYVGESYNIKLPNHLGMTKQLQKELSKIKPELWTLMNSYFSENNPKYKELIAIRHEANHDKPGYKLIDVPFSNIKTSFNGLDSLILVNEIGIKMPDKKEYSDLINYLLDIQRNVCKGIIDTTYDMLNQKKSY